MENDTFKTPGLQELKKELEAKNGKIETGNEEKKVISEIEDVKTTIKAIPEDSPKRKDADDSLEGFNEQIKTIEDKMRKADESKDEVAWEKANEEREKVRKQIEQHTSSSDNKNKDTLKNKKEDSVQESKNTADVQKSLEESKIVIEDEIRVIKENKAKWAPAIVAGKLKAREEDLASVTQSIKKYAEGKHEAPQTTAKMSQEDVDALKKKILDNKLKNRSIGNNLKKGLQTVEERAEAAIVEREKNAQENLEETSEEKTEDQNEDDAKHSDVVARKANNELFEEKKSNREQKDFEEVRNALQDLDSIKKNQFSTPGMILGAELKLKQLMREGKVGELHLKRLEQDLKKEKFDKSNFGIFAGSLGKIKMSVEKIPVYGKIMAWARKGNGYQRFGKRILISAGMGVASAAVFTGGAAITGLAAVGTIAGISATAAIGSMAGGAVGSFVGGEVFGAVTKKKLEKDLDDIKQTYYREVEKKNEREIYAYNSHTGEKYDARDRELLKRLRTQKAEGNITDEGLKVLSELETARKEQATYLRRSMADRDVLQKRRQIKNDKGRMIAKGVGGLVGAIGTGMAVRSNLISHPDVTPEPHQPTPEVTPKPHFTGDVEMVRAGEGYSHAIKRLLEDDPKLAEYFNVDPDHLTKSDYGEIARKLGYIKGNAGDAFSGHAQVGVIDGKGAALEYEMKLGADGKVESVEFFEQTGGHIDANGDYVGGHRVEVNPNDGAFEGANNIESVKNVGRDQAHEYMMGTKTHVSHENMTTTSFEDQADLNPQLGNPTNMETTSFESQVDLNTYLDNQPADMSTTSFEDQADLNPQLDNTPETPHPVGETVDETPAASEPEVHNSPEIHEQPAPIKLTRGEILERLRTSTHAHGKEYLKNLEARGIINHKMYLDFKPYLNKSLFGKIFREVGKSARNIGENMAANHFSVKAGTFDGIGGNTTIINNNYTNPVSTGGIDYNGGGTN